PSFTRVPWLMRAGRMPRGLRGTVAGVLRSWPGHPRVRRLGEFLEFEPTVDSAMNAIRGVFTEAETEMIVEHFVPGAGLLQRPRANVTELYSHFLPEAVSAHELSHYMRNQLLRDSDVASMAWSLELRVPLVDRDFVNALSRIP